MEPIMVTYQRQDDSGQISRLALQIEGFANGSFCLLEGLRKTDPFSEDRRLFRSLKSGLEPKTS